MRGTKAKRIRRVTLRGEVGKRKYTWRSCGSGWGRRGFIVCDSARREYQRIKKLVTHGRVGARYSKTDPSLKRARRRTKGRLRNKISTIESLVRRERGSE